jgi:hypothetical protein
LKTRHFITSLHCRDTRGQRAAKTLLSFAPYIALCYIFLRCNGLGA